MGSVVCILGVGGSGAMGFDGVSDLVSLTIVQWCDYVSQGWKVQGHGVSGFSGA